MSPIILLAMVRQDHEARQQATARERAARLDGDPHPHADVVAPRTPRLVRALRSLPWSPKSSHA